MCVFTYCDKKNIQNLFVKENGMAIHACVEGFFFVNPRLYPAKRNILVLE